jgi:hypothetical protein
MTSPRTFLYGSGLALCTTACSAPHSTSICQIYEAPESYYGKAIIVSAELRSSRHGTSLIDSRCPHRGIALGASNETAGSFIADAYASGPDQYYKGLRIFATLSGTCQRNIDVDNCLFVADKVLYKKFVKGKPSHGG